MIAIFHLQRGMPSKRKSSACIDYVPALCTHRPSLLPIEWSDENYGLSVWAAFVAYASREVVWTLSFRGRRSRNKVSVGEPAEGSLTSSLPLCFVVFSKQLCERSERFKEKFQLLSQWLAFRSPVSSLFVSAFTLFRSPTFFWLGCLRKWVSLFFTPHQFYFIMTDWTSFWVFFGISQDWLTTNNF